MNDYSLVQHLIPQHIWIGHSITPTEGGRDSPWMRNATLIPHTPVADATTIIFLSQMAILFASISFKFANGVPEEDVHAKHDQQQRGSEGNVSKDLERR